MKATRLLLFLVTMTLLVLSGVLLVSQVTARTTTPDRLEIMRTIGRGHTSAHEMVTQSQSVQDLYRTMLSLPIAPADEICPQYIIANYQLTFYSHNVVVQKANALRGLCQPVTLGSDDIRTATSTFWNFMNKAIVAGTPISTPARTSTSTPVGTPTSTPVRTPTSTPVRTPASTPVGTPASLHLGYK